MWFLIILILSTEIFTFLVTFLYCFVYHPAWKQVRPEDLTMTENRIYDITLLLNFITPYATVNCVWIPLHLYIVSIGYINASLFLFYQIGMCLVSVLIGTVIYPCTISSHQYNIMFNVEIVPFYRVTFIKK